MEYLWVVGRTGMFSLKRLPNKSHLENLGSSQGYHAVTYGWLVGEIIKRVDGRDVGTFFKEEISDPFDINFKIGLSDEDMINCADMILLEDDRIKGLPFSKIKYIPDFLLPKQFINFKKFLLDGNFKIAFQRRDGETKDYVNSTDWRKAQIPSANGHGTSEALAKFYGILSMGCERNGYSLMSPDILHAASSRTLVGLIQFSLVQI
jgi:CubicO group peptidase (beta-lactamase class C family)